MSGVAGAGRNIFDCAAVNSIVSSKPSNSETDDILFIFSIIKSLKERLKNWLRIAKLQTEELDSFQLYELSFVETRQMGGPRSLFLIFFLFHLFVWRSKSTCKV